MAKTSRKTKAKKKDFNKVKLKVGKKKPQANNATETSFKSQSIFIPNQLKDQDLNEVVTSRKQSIPDLLSHLNHFNSTFRKQSLTGLKEILSGNQNFNLEGSGILERVVKVITDDEGEVRKSCISVLSILFSRLPEQKMAPHFSLVLSHLYCAMSHICTGVQKDSFRVFDLCLRFYPQLICRHDDQKLLRYFIELISSKQGNSGGRVLTLKISKKESAIAWRIRVLTRLETLLKMSFSDDVSKNESQEQNVRKMWSEENVGIHLLRTGCRGVGLLLRDMNKTTIIAENTRMSDGDLLHTIIPLLVQCWLEVGGCDLLPKEEEATTTMKVVLSITHQLCKNCCRSADDKNFMINFIRKKYLPTFQKHFIASFPYLENQQIKTDKKGNISNNQQKLDVMDINLSVCNLISLLSTEQTAINDDNISEAFTFIATIFGEGVEYRATIRNEHLENILGCIEALFDFMNAEEEQNLLVEPLYLYCKTLPTKHPSKGIVTEFLMKLFQQYSTLLKNESISFLLLSLPSQLTSIFNELGKKSPFCQISSKDPVVVNFLIMLDCMKSSAQRKHSSYLSSLSDNYSKLLCSLHGNCGRLFCEDLCRKCEDLLAKIFEISIPHLATLESSVSEYLQRICSHPRVSINMMSYVSELLFQRFDPVFLMLGNKVEEKNEEKILFLRFQLSLLTNFGSQEEKLPDNFLLTSFVSLINRQAVVCDFVCDTLRKMCALTYNVYKFIFAFFEKKILVSSEQLNVSALVGFLKLEEHMFRAGIKLPKDVNYLWNNLRYRVTQSTSEELIHKIYVALKSNSSSVKSRS